MMIKPSDYSAVYKEALAQLKTASVEQLPELQSLIKVTADTFNCPMATLSLCDDHANNPTQIFISSVGIEEKGIDSPNSFGRYIVNNKQRLVVQDAVKDPRFKDNPYVQKEMIRSCAGFPICIDPEVVVGSLNVFDNQIRAFDDNDIEQLGRLAQIVEGLLRSNLNYLQAKIAFEEVEFQRVLLARKEELFNELEKVSGVGGWEYDMESDELVWTKQTREIVGVEADFEPTLTSGFDYFAPEARDIIEETVNRAMVTDGKWSSELPFINAKGRHMWVRTTGQGIYKQGKMCRLIGSFQDVSERKFIEQKMNENERLMQSQNSELSAIVANIPNGVAVYDARGLLKYWNEQHIKVYRKESSQMKVRNSFREFLRTRYERQETADSPDELMERMYDAFDASETLRTIYYLKSGEIVEALYSQLPDRGWIITSEDITAQERSREEIEYAAHHDILTGLANRTRFNHYGDTLMSAKESDECQHLLMLIDLDLFKEVNDTYGHSAGDDVLKEVAKRLFNEVESDDLACRFGGDEFAIILSGQNEIIKRAESVAKNIVKAIAQPFYVAEHELTIGISIGMCVIASQDSKLNEALKHADIALYAVKNAGRNGYRFYDPSMVDDRREK
ncbi:diguanylate cyclase [Vibrio sp. CAIM 722]|uniref:Diguanylate cyclase n=1 Tax=Vibrio eleionomae TaxID=2653505 RepID=A0A7X4LPR8_9VIBR|nr:diguanylate cyclase [Vibrio eleionomae]MZI95577.1 diguanylate cyclase [Vibrio eleionomae]